MRLCPVAQRPRVAPLVLTLSQAGSHVVPTLSVVGIPGIRAVVSAKTGCIHT